MVIGVARVDIHFPESRSLKNKRGFIRSIKDRIKNKFNVSIAEVDFQDLWQKTRLAIAAVSNDGRFTDEVLAKAVQLIENDPRWLVVDYKTEVINASI